MTTDPYEPGRCSRCHKPATLVVKGKRMCTSHGEAALKGEPARKPRHKHDWKIHATETDGKWTYDVYHCADDDCGDIKKVAKRRA